MGPVVCVITDRTRWGDVWENALVAQVAAAADAGAHLIQVREADLDGGTLLRLVRRCLDAVRSTPARLIVNDRLDVAVAAGAHGVHLKEHSIAASRIRTRCPRPFLIGQSIHAASDLPASSDDAVDYLFFGTVFTTASKPGRSAAGVGELAAVVGMTTVPVLAVGGITLGNLSQVVGAGAAGVAAIGVFTEATAARVKQVATATAWIDTASAQSLT